MPSAIKFTPGLFVMVLAIFIVALSPLVATENGFPRPITITVVMLACAAATWRVAGIRWAAAVAVCGVSGFALLEMSAIRSAPRAHIVPGFMVATSYTVAATALMHAAFSRATRAVDRIEYGVAAYIFIGIAFGSVHQRISLITPGSYVLGGMPVADDPHSWEDFLWFSFSMLTTAGYSQLSPVSQWARMTSTIEAILGVMYPALFLARLMSAPDGASVSDHSQRRARTSD
jgi:hypothetical protein